MRVPSPGVDTDLTHIVPNKRYRGLAVGDDVTVLAVEHHGPTSATVTYRSSSGGLAERVITTADLKAVSEVTERRWTFDADGALFRLASEARRMKFAHLSDPFAAVDASNIEPFPHQIDAVYNLMLQRSPLRFVLADDPGAGKTVMSGLLIRELMLRGDVSRCLIVAPGSLVEQWQDELRTKFGLHFELMSRSKVEESLTGNPFQERDLLIARVDQLSRADDLRAKLEASDWDLVIVDEAHKMSAHLYGDELRRTKRFELGETLREHSRHLVLLTATPHNGKNEDFLAFMTLVDPARFAGRLRDDQMPDVSDVMRRKVKENLRKFDGERLFPPRIATSVNFELSPLEQRLYDSVTDYVTSGMNRADRIKADGDKRSGLILGFALAGLQRRLASSPDAIYHSLRRRHERLTKQLADLRQPPSRRSTPDHDLPKGVRLSELEDFDFDDYDDEELEELEDSTLGAATSVDPADVEIELAEVATLLQLAQEVRTSRTDSKWVALRELLRAGEFRHSDPPRKLIVFSEHKDTLEYVTSRIRDELGRQDAVVTIHGAMKREDRREVQDRFRVDPTVRVLVATDAAGEGVNLQVANLMVNYDLPWNPNRIEQRFGRIHRIGQKLPCHLWNLNASSTREGKVFERLLLKIEQQKGIYGEEVYNALGHEEINSTLQNLLLKAIREEDELLREHFVDRVIDEEFGTQLKEVLDQRALVAGLGAEGSIDEIRDLMERARARRLQPGFVESFFIAGLELYGGRISPRESERFEVTRVPAAIRANANRGLGYVHDRYGRVTFDKRFVQPEGMAPAELVSPGTPLLSAVVDKVLADHGPLLHRGAMLADRADGSLEPRLLVYLDHAITDGRRVDNQPHVVSRRFEYVEIDRHGAVSNPGGEPYIEYAPLSDEQASIVSATLDVTWADDAAETTAKAWAIEHLAAEHVDEIATVTRARVDKVRSAVYERLIAEIGYWNRRAEEIKSQELMGKKPKLNSGRARARADELEARLVQRRLELDLEASLHNNPPTVVAAALVIPAGLLASLGVGGQETALAPDTEDSDRRAVAAVMDAERALGRLPTAQHHSNPGFDIESVDPATGIHYFIEVKGHKPTTTEIHVSARQVNKAKANPERWRLAVVTLSEDAADDPTVRYLVEPFHDVRMHFAQSGIPLMVASLLADSVDPC